MSSPEVHPRRFVSGDKLGKYQLIRQIAIGGMAELYLARTVGIEGFEKLVVVKRLLPQYQSNAMLVAMFLDEARLTAALHHPNIAQVYDVGRDDEAYFFAMEYVHGEDLHHVVANAAEQGVPLSLDAALTIAAGLCAGLHHAHEKIGPDGRPMQVVHRDVSPTNVLVSYDGAVKVVDFGIARAMIRPVPTRDGLEGKIAYMSPEQCMREARLDRRSDVYSIGSMLYELTTGRLPFMGETDRALLEQIAQSDVPPPRAFVPEYPEALERIVLTALARDPERRFDTALALQGAIEDFAHDSRLRISPLVLARLMSSLFPARLEDWHSAHERGAFFVEQQVVRTLIESGRTPLPAGDDSITLMVPPQDLGGDTPIGQPPITTDPATALIQRVPDGRPVEVTALVRLPPTRRSSQRATTLPIAPSRRRPWLPFVIGAVAIAVGAGASIALDSGPAKLFVPPPPPPPRPAPAANPAPPAPPAVPPVHKGEPKKRSTNPRASGVKPVESSQESRPWNADSKR